MKLCIVAALALLAAPAIAQVEAKEVTEDQARAISGEAVPGVVEKKSPMLLDVPLQSKGGTPMLRYFSLGTKVWKTEETARFVVDKARVNSITVTKEKAKKGRSQYRFEVSLSTDWFRQDIDLTLALLAGERELAKRTWDNLTIGNDAGAVLTFGSSSKSPELEVELADSEWAAIEAGPPLRMNILVDVQGEED